MRAMRLSLGQCRIEGTGLRAAAGNEPASRMRGLRHGKLGVDERQPDLIGERQARGGARGGARARSNYIATGLSLSK